MNDLTRRKALEIAAATGIATVAAGTVSAHGADQDADPAGQKNATAVQGSGPTRAQPPTQEVTLDASKHIKQQAVGGLTGFFGRITPDPNPGRATLTITGLPAGTRMVSVWMTEWTPPNNPHAGGAFFYTSSVQLYADGTNCRVIYSLDWSGHLPAGAQVIYG